MAAFIDDAFTLSGFLTGDSDLQLEPVDFTYRPATSGQYLAWSVGRESLKPNELDKHDSRFLAERLVSWSLKNSRGDQVEVSVDNCSRLHPFVASRLLSIVSGYGVSDQRPDGTQPENPSRDQLDKSLGN